MLFRHWRAISQIHFDVLNCFWLWENWFLLFLHDREPEKKYKNNNFSRSIFHVPIVCRAFPVGLSKSRKKSEIFFFSTEFEFEIGSAKSVCVCCCCCRNCHPKSIRNLYYTSAHFRWWKRNCFRNESCPDFSKPNCFTPQLWDPAFQHGLHFSSFPTCLAHPFSLIDIN